MIAIAVHAGLLFVLVWTFSAVCEDNDDNLSTITCEHITGTVGENVTLICRVSTQSNDLCIQFCMFSDAINGGTELCRKHYSCDQRNFTCTYTPKAKRTTKFKFFLQTNTEWKTSNFTVNITEFVKDSATNTTSASSQKGVDTEVSTKENQHQTSDNTAGITCFTLLLLLLLLIIVFLANKYKKKRHNCTNPFGSHMDYEMGDTKADNDDNST
ncbi:uncharacterized protein LOC127427353 [Myxocyprinus asiaticus]|uniref:uncharacterized protein LOC127427353 n=1 Tax=Myxocyprinus asiaticus TaxID=70543 RepID=UPI0022226E2F|nr:uncharacterized protein LOC127427353 [Myxocyprinus asiaticus]